MVLTYNYHRIYHSTWKITIIKTGYRSNICYVDIVDRWWLIVIRMVIFFGIANNCVFLLHSYALSFLVSYCTCVFDFEIPLFSMSWLDYVFSVYMFFFCLAFCLCWFFCTCLFKLLLENMKSEHNMMYTYMIYIYIYIYNI